jgi:hypothetical protein
VINEISWTSKTQNDNIYYCIIQSVKHFEMPIKRSRCREISDMQSQLFGKLQQHNTNFQKNILQQLANFQRDIQQQITDTKSDNKFPTVYSTATFLATTANCKLATTAKTRK